MYFQTLIEFVGHVVYCFTRSVAEHYDFDEAVESAHLFEYDPLTDTGLEWYGHPIDGEIIYQEYSNKNATTLDYLSSGRTDARMLNAIATESDEGLYHEPLDDQGMAWKRLRPSLLCSLWKSFYFGFLISILGAIAVGTVSIVVYYLSYQTLLKCESYSIKFIPEKLQWMRTISEVIFCSLYFYWFFLNCLFYFRPFQISGMKLKLCLLCLAFYTLDAIYRICFQAFGITRTKLTPKEKVPLIVLFLLCVCLQACVIVKHFCGGPRKTQVKLLFILTTPVTLSYITAVLISYFIYPAFNKEDRSGKMIIAIFTPLITVVVKGISRICIQRLSRISHPGTSFVLLVPLYLGSAVMLRLLQLDLGLNQKFKSVVVIGVIHGIAEVIERSTMVFIDHICHQIFEKRRVPWGGFRTPRRERLAADIAIMSMLYESIAIISVNGFLYFYEYFYSSDNSPLQLLQSFAITTSVPLAIEWFFTSLSIMIETRYQNMPIIAVWRKAWKRHILVAVINSVLVTIWASTYLFIAIKETLTDHKHHNCDMPFTKL